MYFWTHPTVEGASHSTKHKSSHPHPVTCSDWLSCEWLALQQPHGLTTILWNKLRMVEIKVLKLSRTSSLRISRLFCSWSRASFFEHPVGTHKACHVPCVVWCKQADCCSVIPDILVKQNRDILCNLVWCLPALRCSSWIIGGVS